MLKDRVVQWILRHTDVPLVGVDISDRSIKYMKIAQGKNVVFEAFGETEIPEGSVVSGEIRREEEMAALLRDLAHREQACFRGAGIVASLPEEKSFLRPLRLENVKPEDIGTAIRWEIETQIPLPVENLIYDYEVAPASASDSRRTNAVLTAFPRALVESYVRMFASAGMPLAAMELESQAIARAIVPDFAVSPARVILDMGRTRTSFIIVAAGEIVFTTTVAIGGQALEEGIAAVLGVSPEEASRIKKEIGLAKNVSEGKIFSALIPGVGALADELQRAIQAYQNHLVREAGAPGDVAEILLSGGDVNLAGLDTYLASVARIPCRRADSFAALRPRIGDAIPPIAYRESLGYAAAIGLALRGMP